MRGLLRAAALCSWILGAGCASDVHRADADASGPDTRGGGGQGGDAATSEAAATSSGVSSTGGGASGPGDDFDLPAPSVTWGPCDGLTAEYECADVPVPLDWAAPDGPSMTVRTYRRLAATDAPRGTLTFLEGGPGVAGGIDSFGAAFTRERHPDLDLLSLDHRGTGRSGVLQCDVPTDPPTDECLAAIRDADPALLAATTTSASALDASAIAHWFGRGPTRVIYGRSYGTYWAHRVVTLAPHAFDGLILDSPCDAVTGCPSARRDTQSDAVNRTLLALCDGDADCASHLPGGTVPFAERVIAAADRGDCQAALDAGLDGVRMRHVLSQLASDARSLVPAMLFRFDRCAEEDRSVFESVAANMDFYDSLLTLLPSFSLPTNYHVSRAEFWDPSVSIADAESALQGTVAASGASVRWARRFATWPWAIPAVDPALHAWHVETVPTLVLAGGLDASTPMSLIEPLEGALGPGSTFVRMTYARHVESAVASPSGLCARSIIDAFADAPGAPIDAACVTTSDAAQRAALFEPDDADTESWFGTASRYGGG